MSNLPTPSAPSSTSRPGAALVGRLPGLLVGLLLVASGCGGRDPGATSVEPAGVGRVSQAIWQNGDFESDGIGVAPTGWTVTNYSNNGVTGTSAAPPATITALNLGGAGSMINETFIVGGATGTQTDPDLGAGPAFRYPLYGSRAVRVNYKNSTDSGKNKNANSLQQTMTVGLADIDPADGQVHIRFAVAPVLEVPAHSYSQQPYYFVELKNLSRGNAIIHHDFNVAGQAGVPWNTTTSIATGNTTQWLNWALVDIAPGDAQLAVGDQVQLTVIGSGCSLGGHFGRVYVDGIGSVVPGPYVQASGPQSANAGSDITYTLRYSNGGSGSVLGATVNMVTPPGTTFKSTTGSNCTTPAGGATGTVSCPLGTLAPGSAGSLTVTVTVNLGAAGTTVTNGNYSIGGVNAPTLIGPRVSTVIPGQATSNADIQVTASANTSTVNWGGNVTYTVVVKNLGPNAFTTAGQEPQLNVTKPAEFTSWSWTCSRSGSGNRCNLGTSTISTPQSGAISLKPRLKSGSYITLTITGTVKAGQGLGSIVETATSTAPAGLTDPTMANNTAVVTTTIGTPRTLSVTKSGTSTGSVLSTPAGINCPVGTDCSGGTSGTFADGTSVILTAAPAPGGATFTGWGGACNGNAATCTVVMSGNKSVTATFAAAPAVGAAANIYVYQGSGQMTPTGSAFGQLAVLVTDANGTPKPSQAITWTAVPQNGASASFSGATNTNNAGVATVTATANNTAGGYTVTAKAGAVGPATFTLTNVGPAANITYVAGGNVNDPQAGVVKSAFASPLVARVTDLAGNPVPGVQVSFTAPANGASATVPANATTDADGLVSASATANATVGSYTVSTSSIGGSSVAFSLQNVNAGAAAIYVVSGSPQQTASNSAFPESLVAVVADAMGNAVPGVTVTWAAPANGASASLAGPPADLGRAGVSRW